MYVLYIDKLIYFFFFFLYLVLFGQRCSCGVKQQKNRNTTTTTTKTRRRYFVALSIILRFIILLIPTARYVCLFLFGQISFCLFNFVFFFSVCCCCCWRSSLLSFIQSVHSFRPLRDSRQIECIICTAVI